MTGIICKVKRSSGDLRSPRGAKGERTTIAARRSSEKAQTHAQLLRRAAESFRLHGTSVGIGDIMKQLGMTHGGFYKHFGSKDQLLVEAITLGFTEVADRLERAAQAAEPGRETEAIIRAYLSPEHLRNPQTWCVLATLAPEIARQPASLRKRLDGAAHAYMERLSKYMPGATPEERSGTFFILFSAMAAAIAAARSTGDGAVRDLMLAAARDYYLKTFARGGGSGSLAG